MCYKGDNELRRVILVGLFIYPSYQAYLQWFAKKQQAGVVPATVLKKSAELDVQKKSKSVVHNDLEQIKCFQEVHSSNNSDSPEVTKVKEKPPMKIVELETSSDSPSGTN